MGLVDYVAEPGAAVVTALAWGPDIAAGAPGAIAEMTTLLRGALAPMYTHVRALERDAFIRTWSSPEHAEAMEAYFARRPPSWTR